MAKAAEKTLATVAYKSSGITSERRLCEEVKMHIGYRWFVGLNPEDKVSDHSIGVYTKAADSMFTGREKKIAVLVQRKQNARGTRQGQSVTTYMKNPLTRQDN